MKLNAALAKSLLMAASVGMVTPIVAQTNTGKTPAPSKTAPPPAKEEPAEEAEPQIPGTVIPRKTEGFLGLTLVNGNFRLDFFDAKKKPITADVARATARWNSPTRSEDDRCVLNPVEDGKALLGNRFVRPPYAFKLYLTLLSDEGTAVETHVIDFRG